MGKLSTIDPAESRAAGKTSRAGSGSPPFSDMVWIPGGTFLMGSNRHYPEEAPAHHATVGGFWMVHEKKAGREAAERV